MTYHLVALDTDPLHLARSPAAGNRPGTLEYVPGTSIRGALAKAYLARNDLQAEVDRALAGAGWDFRRYFEWLFLSGSVRFGNLYPRGRGPSQPIPLSARSCKYLPGFPGDPERPARHGVVDLLLGRAPADACRASWQGNACGAPLAPLPGFYEPDPHGRGGPRRVRAKPRYLTRTAVETETRTVRSGALYSLEALEETGVDGSITGFAGPLRISAPAGLEPALAGADGILGRHLAGPLAALRIGAARTRGLGGVRLELHEAGPELEPLRDRFDALQEFLAPARHGRDAELAFTLTLRSDAIVVDDLFRFRSVLDPDALAAEAGPMPTVRLVRSFTQTRPLAGWNAAHRLPKEDELAIVKGAAFVYSSPAPADELLPFLRRIEAHGIGERAAEGFGDVVACHPFHMEFGT